MGKNATKKQNNTAPKAKAPEKAPKAPEAKPEAKPETGFAWNKKYEACTECGGTDHKHYSGGLCTKCYTQKRNQKLGLGLYDKETQARKAERLESRIARLEDELKELKAQRKILLQLAS